MNCPKCHSDNVESDVPNHPGFHHCTCEDCEYDFCYDSYREEYYEINGDVIKEEGKK